MYREEVAAWSARATTLEHELAAEVCARRAAEARVRAVEAAAAEARSTCRCGAGSARRRRLLPWVLPGAAAVLITAEALFVWPVAYVASEPSLELARQSATSAPAVDARIALLHTIRNEQLYYTDASFPPHAKNLVASGDTGELIRAYWSDSADPLFRFNIMMILNEKAASSTDVVERRRIARCFRDALRDGAAWVRTEAVWGLGALRMPQFVADIIPLLDDADKHVVNETILALSKLTGGQGPAYTSNESLNAQQRATQVESWKRWWQRRRAMRAAGEPANCGPSDANEYEARR
jgi:hypothetical protein